MATGSPSSPCRRSVRLPGQAGEPRQDAGASGTSVVPRAPAPAPGPGNGPGGRWDDAEAAPESAGRCGNLLGQASRGRGDLGPRAARGL